MMSGFILNRGKSFAARYKEFESKSVPNIPNENDVKKQLVSCSPEKITVTDREPVISLNQKSDDEVEIDVDLSRTGPSKMVASKVTAKGRKRNGKKGKRSPKTSKLDNKSKLVIPKFETFDSDNESDGCKLDNGYNLTEELCEDSMEPNLDMTIVDEPNPCKERLTFRTLKVLFNGKIHKFPVDYEDRILKHLGSFYKTFELSKRTHELVITYKDKVVTFTDSAKSLDLTIVDFLEAYAKERSEPLEKSSKVKVHRDPNSIEIKVRNNQDGKHDQPLTIYLDKNATMSKLMKQYAEAKKYNLSELLFEFDGERLCGEETPLDLDMENGSLIDVRIKK